MTQTEKTYGGALYELAAEEGLSEKILEELETLSAVFAENPQFMQLLGTPSVAKQERVQILDDCFRGKIQPYFLNFLKILCEKGIIRSLKGCGEEFRKRYYEDHGILEVRAVSAVALKDAQKQALCAKLKEMTGKEIALNSTVDPHCIGGVRLELEGQEFDGTIRSRLDAMRALLAASAC